MNRREQRVIRAKRESYFLEVMYITLLAGAILHGGLIGYFFWLGVPVMGYYNIFSTLLFTSGFFLLRAHPSCSNIYFIIGSLEVILHAVLATYFVVADAGFPLFLWAIPPVIILHSKISDWAAVTSGILIAVLYVLLSEVLMSPKGIYPIDEATTKYSFYVCFFSAVSITMAIIFYYRKIVSRKEQIILREIHHRIKNNLQMVSSIASIRNTDESEEKTSSVLDELKTDVWYLSAMHNQVVVTDGGTSINFSRFMNAVMVGANLQEEGSEETKELYLNLETGIPLGLIASQIVEFCNRLKVNHPKGTTKFSIVNSSEGQGEISVLFSCEKKLDVGSARMEDSSSEIIALLLEQLDGSHQFEQSEHGVRFNVCYKVI